MKTRSPILDWPEPVNSSKYVPVLNLGDLNQDEKQILWRHIKTNFSQKAIEIANIMQDPVVQSLQSEFGASLTLDAFYVPEQLKHLIK